MLDIWSSKTEIYPITRIFPSGLHKNVDIFGDKFTLTTTKIFTKLDNTLEKQMRKQNLWLIIYPKHLSFGEAERKKKKK